MWAVLRRSTEGLPRSAAPKKEILGRQSGQALLEMAIVTPMLLLLMLGLIEIGRYAYIAILVGNAARAGAAYGAQSHAQASQATGTDSITTAANNDFQNNGRQTSSLTVTSTFSCGCDSGGAINPPPSGTNAYCFLANAINCTGGGHFVEVVSVTASSQFSSLFNYPGLPSPITVTRTSQMRVAN